MLKIERVVIRWPRAAAALINSFTMEVDAGRIISIVGQNGVGKSTLLRGIAGRESASFSGSVYIDGRPLASSDTSYMPQNPDRVLFPHLTLAQNIRLHGPAQPAVDPVELEQLESLLFPQAAVLQRFPSHCSGGQKQRATLCRALLDMRRFRLSLLDEPFSQLSFEIKPRIYSTLRNLTRTRQRCTILVSHDISEALIVGDETWVIAAGCVTRFDTSRVTDQATLASNSSTRNAVEAKLSSPQLEAI